MKFCTYCNIEKSEEEFRKNNDKISSCCKLCNNYRMKQWRLKNPDKVKATKKKYRLENPDKIKQIHYNWRKNNPDKLSNLILRNRYGLTLQEYDTMLEQQNHKCAMCGRSKDDFKKRLHVDHDHKTGKIRGILCGGCNHAIAILDNKDLLEKAKKYLGFKG